MRLVIAGLLLAGSAANGSTMIKVHRLDHAEVSIAASKIAGLTPTVHHKTSPHRLMHPDANCIVTMGNGRIQGILETCDAVHEMIEKAH